MIRQSLALLTVIAAVATFTRAEDPKPETKQTGVDQAALEKQFEEAMTGATLVGYFTSRGQDASKGLKEEKYTLVKVSKLQGDLWLFQSRIQYGDHDVTVPLPLQVKWAGDTPVITLTDMTIPGLGTYTARVLFYRGEYAGTWSGGSHGGQLFGKIVKEKEAGEVEKKETEDKTK